MSTRRSFVRAATTAIRACPTLGRARAVPLSAARTSSSARALERRSDDDRHHHHHQPREPPQENDHHHHHVASSPPLRRPRLEALRRRLRLDDEGDRSVATTDLLRRKRPPSATTTTTSTTDVEDGPTPTLARTKDKTTTTTTNNNNVNEHAVSSDMLTDQFGRFHNYLRVSLSERCNLRCLYCMPAEGVPLQPKDDLLTADEIARLVNLFARAGVDKVRLTGGEPLLRADLPRIVESIAAVPTIRSVGVTTNGISLSRRLPELVDAGLTHVNVSLDTLCPTKFTEITRRKGHDRVLRAIDDAVALCRDEGSPLRSVKLNCVVMKGFNDDELTDFVQMSKHFAPLDVRFIEWMPFQNNGWNKDRFYSYRETLDRITSRSDGDGGLDLRRVPDGANDTTKWWRIDDGDDDSSSYGRVGFITSMSEHFCGTCNRLRLTADGRVKACLFGTENGELSLRDVLRTPGSTEDDLVATVAAAVERKTFALGGHGDAQGIADDSDANRPMTLIGG